MRPRGGFLRKACPRMGRTRTKNRKNLSLTSDPALCEAVRYPLGRRKAFIQSTDLDKPSSVFWARERASRAKEKPTIGQRMYSLNREALGQLLSLAEGLFAQGKSCQDVLEVFMLA